MSLPLPSGERYSDWKWGPHGHVRRKLMSLLVRKHAMGAVELRLAMHLLDAYKGADPRF